MRKRSLYNRAQQEYIACMGFNSVLIPHGIESSILSISAQKANAPIIISVVAELMRLKNINWLVRTVCEYSGQQNIQLMIAGDGVCREELQRLAGDAPNIHFLGKIKHDEVMKLLEKSHIFAMPSSPETFGLVYLEAAAKCNAVICHRNEGVDGLFEDGKEMLFCGGYDEFKAMLNRLIENPQEVKILADNGYAKAKNYTWEVVRSRYMEIYRHVLACGCDFVS